MTNLTDLEICKRIAEIEGFTVSKCGHTKDGVWCSMYENNCYGHYNPLTDDALCFRLMVKYEVCIYFFNQTASIFKNSETKTKVIHFFMDEVNRAICLAIIAAHEEE